MLLDVRAHFCLGEPGALQGLVEFALGIALGPADASGTIRGGGVSFIERRNPKELKS
jgi:hypothetical protein